MHGYDIRHKPLNPFLVKLLTLPPSPPSPSLHRFVMNYLNWGNLKERSNIYERFASVGMDFVLSRRNEDNDPTLLGPQGAKTNAWTELVKSENGDKLDDSNSILVETESLQGIWQHR